MLSTIFRRKPAQAGDQLLVTKYPIASSGRELLSSPGRTALIRKIKRLFSITEDVWVNHYLYAIE